MSREPGIKPDPDMKPRASGNATNHQATVISAVDGSNDGGYLFSMLRRISHYFCPYTGVIYSD